jgi:hypothetical protein
MRRNPAASEILVEQDLGNGVFVQLFERRMVAAGEVSPSGRRDANERLRSVRGPVANRNRRTATARFAEQVAAAGAVVLGTNTGAGVG